VNDTTFLYKDLSGQTTLFCEDILLSKLAAEFGTPLYVYSQSQILENFREFKSLMSDGNYVSYAIKANSNLEILKLLAIEGAGGSVVSGGELRAALKAGFDPKRITFDGPGKTDEEISLALQSGIFAIDIESLQELSVVNDIAATLGKNARICIRVNPHVDAKTHPYISTGLAQNKFGIPLENAFEAYRLAQKLPNIEIAGIHCHIGSQITTLAPFIEAAESIGQFISQLKKQEGIEIRHINFGGGIGVKYHSAISHKLLNHSSDTPLPAIFTPKNFQAAIFPILSGTGCTFNFEPGRAIVADAGVLLARTLYTKSNLDKHFIIVDASMTDLIRPSLYHAYHQIVPLSLRNDISHLSYDVVGPDCETTDFLAQDRTLPKMERGDFLAILSTGAYGYVLASNYNLRPRAAEVLVNGSTYRIIRERERVEDIIE
jgi:diaminopimelate decarboxylase